MQKWTSRNNNDNNDKIHFIYIVFYISAEMADRFVVLERRVVEVVLRARETWRSVNALTGEERDLVLSSEWDLEPVKGVQDGNDVVVLIVRILIIYRNLHVFVLREFFMPDFIAYHCFL